MSAAALLLFNLGKCMIVVFRRLGLLEDTTDKCHHYQCHYNFFVDDDDEQLNHHYGCYHHHHHRFVVLEILNKFHHVSL